MADNKKPAGKPAAGGKSLKKSKSNARWKMYKVSGDKLERLNQYCPKCGAGSYLAKHKDRLACGKCGYMEAIRK